MCSSLRFLRVLSLWISLSLAASAQAVWTGAASDSWFDTANWSTGLLPDANVDVTIPNVATAPRILAGTATTRDLTITVGAQLSVEGTGTLEVRGDIDLLAGGGTGVLALDTDTSQAKVYGTWTQNDVAAVTSNGGRVAFEGGAQIAGSAVYLPFARLATGTTTLLNDVEFGDLDATGGTSAGGFDWVVAGAATLASGTQPIHRLRIDAGQLTAQTSWVQELRLVGGTLLVATASDLFVETALDLQAGMVNFGNLGSSQLRVGGSLTSAQAVAWGSGYIDMDGTTSVQGPGGTPAFLNRLRFKSGICTLATTVEIASWVGSSGGAVVGEWIELNGPAAFLSSAGGPLHRVRLKGGQAFAFNATVDEFELTGGTLQVISGQTLTVEERAELSAGTIQWNSPTSARFVVTGDLVSSPAVTFGNGFIEMSGTTSISGPGGAAARVGSVRIAAGTCTLLTPVGIDQNLAATGGTTTGEWFEMLGTNTTLDGPASNGMALAKVRVAGGRCVADSGAIGTLELTGGILEVPQNKTLVVTGNAELLGGQLEFSGTAGCALDVLGDVHQVATAKAVTMNANGNLRCFGVWTADAALDLGASFVEFAGTSSITGVAPEFENLRIDAGATVSLLNAVRVNGTLASDGGTTQGQAFEFWGPSAELATGEHSVHEVRIKAGVTEANNATVSILKLEAGELQVPGLKTLTVETSCELIGGTLGLDPLDTGLAAKLVVQGNVTLTGTVAALGTGSGGTLRCEGIWFGLGSADLGKAFVELAGGATVLGSGAPFGRLRIVEGSASLNVQASVTTELVVEADAAVTGFFPLIATPGVGNTLVLSGAGTVAELHVVDGTVEAQGVNATTLRLKGGRYVAVGAAEAGNVFVEGGELWAREGGALIASGHLELTAGVLDFELDPAGATGAEARIEAASVRQVGATGGAGLANGVLACRGTWTGDAALSIGPAWVELGADAASGAVTGSAASFANVRVVGGTVALAADVPVSGRLEFAGGATSGAWWVLNGAELATGAVTAHRVRVASGQVRALVSAVDALEVVGGELLIDGGGTVTVNEQLDLLGGTLGFDAGVGPASARLLVLGAAHQVGTGAGSVTSADGSLTVAGDLVVDAPLVLGQSFVELRHGARLLGLNASLDRLRILAYPGQASVRMDALGGVGSQFEVAPGARLELVGGGLVLLPDDITLEGALEVRAPASLALKAGTTLTVAPTGRLALLGNAAATANLQAYVAGGYQVVVDGTFAARNFVLRDMGAFTFGSTSSLGPEGLHAGRVERGLAAGGGPLLDLGFAAGADCVGVDFIGKAGDTNVRRAAGGEVIFHAFGGALGGAPFEDDPTQGPADPDGLIVWQNLPVVDLVALDVTGAPEAVLGWPLELEFSVVNQGTQTATAPWVDRVFLSSNAVAGDADDVLLVEVPRAADLAAGKLYAQQHAPTVPAVDEGTYWLVATTDAAGAVTETGFEANNAVLSASFEIFATPRPNLVAADVAGPASADDGTAVLVSWSVVNAGLGATDEGGGMGGTWTDRVYLSSDPIFGADFQVASVAIDAGAEPGGIAPGEGYQRELLVTLPAGIQGDHYLIVRTDALDEVTPETQEADNIAVAVAPITIQQPHLPDLVGSFAPVTSPLGALFVNTEVDVSWTVTNVDADLNGLGSANGAWADRFWLSFDTTIQPGIDTLVFEAEHHGVLAPTATYGDTRTLTLPSIPGTWFLIGEVDAADTVPEGSEANTWFAPLSVVAPTWTGTVATTLAEGLASSGPGTQLVTLTGTATQVSSSILVPNVDLTVRIRQGNTRRVYDVTTNAAGAFTLTFEPMVGEAGLFDVFCDHPAVLENPALPQDSFVLHHLAVTPLELAKGLVTGDVQRVSLGIENPGAQPLTGITFTPVGLPAHLALQNLTVPTSLAAGASDVITFELVALLDDPTPGPDTWTIDLGFDLAGVPTVTTSVPVTVWVTPGQPDLDAVGLSAVAQVAAGGATQVRFHIVNTGGAPLTNASLVLDTPASLGLGCATSAPFVLAVPSALGAIAPGEARLVAFDVVAGVCADLGLGAQVPGFTVQVIANEGAWSFPMTLQVVSSPTAGLLVRVEDANTWWNPGGVALGGSGARVIGATVTLTDGLGQATSLVTGSSGQVLFSGLPSGLYAAEVRAATGAHVPWRGVVELTAGAAPTLDVYLPSRDADVALAGVAEFGGSDLVWTASQSAVGPGNAARVRVEGGPLDLELGVGESRQFDLFVRNSGSAPARGIEWFATGFDDYTIEPAFAYVGDLTAGQSVPLVVTVTRTGAGDPCALADVNLGVRFYVEALHPIWRWAPAFALSADADCTPYIAGVAPPLDLPAPLVMPGAHPAPGGGLMAPVVQYLGSGAESGAAPNALARPLPPTSEQADADVTVAWQIAGTRTSVNAPLELQLALTNDTLDLLGAVDVALQVTAANGTDVTASFLADAPTLVGIGAIDGDPALANLGPGAAASATWQVTPDASLAAGTYRVAATLTADLEGTPLVFDLAGQTVFVQAVPRLEVEVYTPSRTHADWSSTPLFFEDAEPFALGVVIRNTGGGGATDLALASVGPVFAADPLGAALFASAVELEVDGVVQPGGFGLQAGELGDLAPGAERRILWTATASGAGQLTELPLQLFAGGALVTPASVTSAELVHATVAFEPPLVDDGKVDWLLAADPAPLDPTTGLPFSQFATRVRMSDGTERLLQTHISPPLGAPPTPSNLNSSATITSPGSQWHYLRFNDPGGALYDLAQVTRVQKAAYVGGLGVGGPGDVSRVWTTARWVDVTADGVPDFVRREVHIVDYIQAAGTFEYTLGYVPGSSAALSADIQVIDASVGGTQHLTLDAGPARAGEIYVLVGTLSGTQPGTPYGTVVAPINVDNYTLTLLTNPSVQALFGSIGVLDGQGRGTAQVPVPPGFKVGGGVTAHHAFITLPLTKPVDFVSNAVALFVLP